MEPKIFVAKTRTYQGFFLYYHLALTDECNLRCSYCKGRFDDEPRSCDQDRRPQDYAVDMDLLCSFLEHDPDAVLIFYGGEPLLRTDLLDELIRLLPAKRFMLHTNGTLLDLPARETLAGIEKIQVSIDGGREITDRNRGEGTYGRIIKNIEYIRNNGFKSEIVARMTVENGTPVRDAVLHLDSLSSFSSVHWQLNAMFYEDYTPSFTEWAENEYIPGIRALARDWVGIMKDEERIPRWYPFLAPVHDMLAGVSDCKLRCGCGFANYTITTDGSIAPCPCMHGFEGVTLGHIGTSRPDNLPTAEIAEPCSGCDIREFCGGRCLYAHTALLWPEEGRKAVCDTIRGLKDALEAVLPEIKKLILEGKIKKEDFGFERYWGCEIIP